LKNHLSCEFGARFPLFKDVGVIAAECRNSKASTSLHQVSIYDHRHLVQRAGARFSDRNLALIASTTYGTTNPRTAHSIARVMPRWRKVFASSSRVACSEK
jgi:hypothetical protein